MKEKICRLCGKKFYSDKNAKTVCDDVHYRNCKFCGTPFVITMPSNSQQCCSKECTVKLRQQTMMNRYGVANTMERPDFVEKARNTTMLHYGVTSPAKSKDILKKMQDTCEKNHGVRVPFKMKDFAEKSRNTCLEKYGVEYTSQIPGFIEKMQATNMLKYGAKAPIGNREIRQKMYRNTKNHSSLELRLHKALTEMNIKYEYEYVISKDGHTHAFDVYLPDYKYLIDCDGVYFHSYISDPDGKKVRDDYDEVRLYLIPEDYRFRIIVESDFERGLRELFNDLEEINSGIFDFDSDIFKWCRSIEFPYYNYDDERLIGDFIKLCEVPVDKYVSGCKYGISVINQFHKSIFDCHVGKNKSVKEAWYDDTLLKKCIKNRLIYKNDVDPAKVLAGFNISKIAPKVSVFNPVLAKYLISKYLSEYNTIFDPFSGFSGRMLGAASLGRTYIGQDLNANAVRESNEIINYLELENCSVTNIDSLEQKGEYPCLFTCPPYGKTEIYNSEKIFYSCDDWIEQILDKYKCERYLFVVDKTGRFKNNIIGKIPCKSHFRNNKELVILIENKD